MLLCKAIITHSELLVNKKPASLAGFSRSAVFYLRVSSSIFASASSRPEVQEKIRQALKGKPKTPEHIAKIKETLARKKAQALLGF